MIKKQKALSYATAGYKIFPIWWIDENGKCACGDPDCGNPASKNNPGKHPISGSPGNWIARNGRLDSTANVQTIDKWWSKYPEANIGLDCSGNGLIVIDVDLHDGMANGFDSLDDWETTHEEKINSSVSAETGGGGVHLIFTCPGILASGGGCPGGLGKNYPAIDLKFNGYILLAPSNHKSGSDYAWSEKSEDRFLGKKVPPLPASIEKFIRESKGGDNYSPQRYSAPSRIADDEDEQQIVDALNCISFFSLNDDERLKVGMGLQQALPGGKGKALYFDWLQSHLGSKFNYKFSERRWRSFKYRSGGRSIASFFEVAASCGFVNEGKVGHWVNPDDFVFMEPTLVAEEVQDSKEVMFVQDEVKAPMYIEEWVLPSVMYVDDSVEAAPDVPKEIEIVKYHGENNMSMSLLSEYKNKYLTEQPDPNKGMPKQEEWREWFDRLNNNPVLCSLFRWQVENNTAYVPELAAAFTICAAGGLLSGRFRYDTLTTNLYFMVIAETSVGKSETIKMLKKIFDFTNDTKRIGPSEIISDKGFINDLILDKARLFPLDEIGELFSNIFSQKANSSQKMIKKAMLDGFTSFGVKSNVTASRADAKNAPVQDIGNTSPSILGLTTPAKIYDTMSSTDIIDGMLNRMLMLVNEEKNHVGKMPMKTEIPQEFASWFMGIRGRWTGGGVMHVDDSDTCSELYMSPEAKITLSAIKDIEGKRKAMGERYGPIWGRLTEITIRVSLIFELTARPYSGLIEEDSIVAAYRFVSWCLEKSESVARNKIADSEEQSIAKEVHEFIRNCPNGALYQDIMDNTRLGANLRMRSQILSSLKDEQKIKEFSYKEDKNQRGRPQKMFFTPDRLAFLPANLKDKLKGKGLEI